MEPGHGEEHLRLKVVTTWGTWGSIRENIYPTESTMRLCVLELYVRSWKALRILGFDQQHS